MTVATCSDRHHDRAENSDVRRLRNLRGDCSPADFVSAISASRRERAHSRAVAAPMPCAPPDQEEFTAEVAS